MPAPAVDDVLPAAVKDDTNFYWKIVIDQIVPVGRIIVVWHFGTDRYTPFSFKVDWSEALYTGISPFAARPHIHSHISVGKVLTQLEVNDEIILGSYYSPDPKWHAISFRDTDFALAPLTGTSVISGNGTNTGNAILNPSLNTSQGHSNPLLIIGMGVAANYDHWRYDDGEIGALLPATPGISVSATQIALGSFQYTQSYDYAYVQSNYIQSAAAHYQIVEHNGPYNLSATITNIRTTVGDSFGSPPPSPTDGEQEGYWILGLVALKGLPGTGELDARTIKGGYKKSVVYKHANFSDLRRKEYHIGTNGRWSGFTDEELQTSADSPSVRYNSDGNFSIVYHDTSGGDGIKHILYRQVEGKQVVQTLANGTHPCHCFDNNGRLILIYYKASDTTFRVRVGTLDSNGRTYTMSGEVNMSLTDPANSRGSVEVMEDNTINFVYRKTGNDIVIVRCTQLNSDGTGTWG